MTASSSSAEPAPILTRRGDLLTLAFRPGDIQSAMSVSWPDKLVLAYTRAMMCFALFVPRPRHILMVGLGGGSLAKFCYRHFPQARVTVVELRADVIALRDTFLLPPDDARLRVIQGDAVEYIRTSQDKADVILIDGFDAHGLVPTLGTARFYAACRALLNDGGVLVKNIFSYERHYGAMVARLGLIFDGRVCALRGVAGNNRILFAVKAPAALPRRDWPRALRVQHWVARRQGLWFGWLNRLLVRSLIEWLEWH